jgi:hypothetical protein
MHLASEPIVENGCSRGMASQKGRDQSSIVASKG